MKFIVDTDVFKKIPNICFGVVVARGIDTRSNFKGLDLAVRELQEKYSERKAKELGEIIPYREVFKNLGYNPNKFMPSIEALTTRVLKQKRLPSILPVVDAYNSISLKYLLPIGGHDINTAKGDIEVRFSNNLDSFTPFGSSDNEIIDEKELVYAVGNEIKTRRWIWRQGELGKITDKSTDIFFPIDGFEGINDMTVKEATRELASLLKSTFNCEVTTAYINRDKSFFDF